MPNNTVISELRVVATLDSSNYDEGARRITAADATLVAGMKQVDVDFGNLSGRINLAGDSLSSLSRRYLDGFRAEEQFARGLRSLNGMLETNRVEATRAEAIYSGMAGRLGMVANAADLTAKGYGQIGTVIERVNTQLAEQATLADRAATGLHKVGTAHPANDNSAAFRRQNLGFQAQDIAVSLYGGMPIGTVLAQQGSQIAGSYMGAGGGMKAVREDIGAISSGAWAATKAIGEMLGPVGSVAVAFAGVTAAAATYYGLTRESAAEAAERIKAENELIGTVAKRWGDALPGIRAYNEELERKLGLDERQKATDVFVARQYTDAAAKYPELPAGVAEAKSLIATNGVSSDPSYPTGVTFEQLTELNKAFDALDKDMTAHTATAAEAQRVQAALQSIFDSSKVYGIDKTAAAYGNLAVELGKASEAATGANSALQGLTVGDQLSKYPLDPIGITRGSPFQSEEDIMFDRSRRQREAEENQRLGALVPIPTERPNYEDVLADQEAAAKKHQSALEKQQSAYQRTIESANERMAQMRLEASLYGQFGASVEAARYEQQLLNQAQEKGKSLTDPQKQAIHELAAEYGNLADAMKQAQFNADLRFDAAQMNRSPSEQQIASKLRNTGFGMDSPQANALREMDRVEQLRSGVRSFFDDWQKGIESGAGIGQSLGQALKSSLMQGASEALSTGLDSLVRQIIPMPELSLPQTTASMSVSAGVVTVNGGIGGVPGIGDAAKLLPGAGTQSGQFSATGLADRVTSAIASKVAGPGDGSFTTVGNYHSGVNVDLTSILQTAAQRSGLRVDAFSGFRAGDSRLHGQGLATDVRLFDAAGKAIPNYQNAAGFRSYEQFAQVAHQVAVERGIGGDLRWGGYFSGGRGKYGAMDTMHFDLGGRRGMGMAGGSWDHGLTSSQRALFPGAESIGMTANKAVPQLERLATGAGKAGDASLGAANSFASTGSVLTQAVKGIGSILDGASGGKGWSLTNLFGLGLSNTGAGFHPTTTGFMDMLMGKADGGPIHGPGTGTSDSILARLSDGEYVVNARSTKRHRGLLDMINGGADLLGFAAGGFARAGVPDPYAAPSPEMGEEMVFTFERIAA